MKRLNKSLTLLELLIALVLFSVILLAFTSIQYFSRFHLVTSERQSQLQNELSLALEHMGKSVQLGVGYPPDNPPNYTPPNHPAIEQRPANDGFRVYIEPTPPTPGNPAGDITVNYILNNHSLSNDLDNVTFSTHILSGVVYGLLPANPANGFYINITENSSMVEIGLVARWQPDNPVSFDNPQVVMKTGLYARGSATH